MPQVTGPLTTTAPSDVFGTHDAQYGIDGLRSVVDHAARNAITDERRRSGMMVYTQNDGKYWSLKPDPDGVWSKTDADWTLLEFGAGKSVESQTFDFPTPINQWVMDHTLGGYPSVTTMDTNHEVFVGNISYPSTSRVVVDFAPNILVAGTGVLRNSG